MESPDHEAEPEDQERGITSPPPQDANQTTTPPGNPPIDEEALRAGEERLEQAGGGH